MVNHNFVTYLTWCTRSVTLNGSCHCNSVQIRSCVGSLAEGMERDMATNAFTLPRTRCMCVCVCTLLICNHERDASKLMNKQHHQQQQQQRAQVVLWQWSICNCKHANVLRLFTLVLACSSATDSVIYKWIVVHFSSIRFCSFFIARNCFFVVRIRGAHIAQMRWWIWLNQRLKTYVFSRPMPNFSVAGFFFCRIFMHEAWGIRRMLILDCFPGNFRICEQSI